MSLTKKRKIVTDRKLKVHTGYIIKNLYDRLNQVTGELEPHALAEYNTDKFHLAQNKDKNNIRKKTSLPFVRIDKTATVGLENNEKLVYYLLTERITWGNNFVRNPDGTLSSISQLSNDKIKNPKTGEIHINKDNIGIGRKHLNEMLESLEKKKRIAIVDYGNVKSIYLYSRYVWFGFEKDRNDKALNDITIIQVVR